jgi:hypothetical protein
VMAWTVVIRPSMIPKLSLMTWFMEIDIINNQSTPEEHKQLKEAKRCNNTPSRGEQGNLWCS